MSSEETRIFLDSDVLEAAVLAPCQRREILIEFSEGFVQFGRRFGRLELSACDQRGKDRRSEKWYGIFWIRGMAKKRKKVPVRIGMFE